MRKGIYLALMILLVGCTLRSSWPVLVLGCDELSAASIRSELSKQITTEQLETLIRDSFHIPIADIRVDITGPGQTSSWGWKTDDITYSAIVKDSVLTALHVSYDQRRPLAEHFVACLGTPDRYRARYERIPEVNQLGFDMLFASYGVFTGGVQYRYSDQNQPPPLDGSFPISSLHIVPPGTVEKVVHESYSSDSLGEWWLRESRPWPGDWNSLVIDIDPTLTR